MDYREHIAKAINYIEDNLQNDMSLAELAHVAAYSQYHFIRIFKEVTKLTPADYIRKRRLTEIAKKIAAQEDIAIADIAFEYGFNSKENFIRAFRDEHSILPSEYKKALNSLKLTEKLEYKPKSLSLTPEIRIIEAFFVTGYFFDIRHGLNLIDIPKAWNIYNGKKFSKKLSGGVQCRDFGICVFKKEGLKYFIGIDSSSAVNKDGASEIFLDKAQCAVFDTPQATQASFVIMIHNTWKYINNEWLPNSGYKRTGAPEYESYIEQSRTFSEKIYIPIK